MTNDEIIINYLEEYHRTADIKIERMEKNLAVFKYHAKWLCRMQYPIIGASLLTLFVDNFAPFIILNTSFIFGMMHGTRGWYHVKKNNLIDKELVVVDEIWNELENHLIQREFHGVTPR